jgi:hypothetical protein
MEAGVKGDNFTDNSEVAIELTDLTAQIGEAVCQHDGIVSVVAVKKAIDRSLDQGGFRRLTTLRRRCQSHRGALGEIDTHSRFHHRPSLKSTRTLAGLSVSQTPGSTSSAPQFGQTGIC